MKFDIFLSICQTEVDGYLPSERTMFENFFDQVRLADQLGFDIAWIAESHLSCQVQKENSEAVIPHFKGEIGLNTDIFQLAHKVFAQTKRIHIGSAIRNILCNGGPLAHAEAAKTFLTLHGLDPHEQRKMHLGIAAGRFPFSNKPYGIKPRNVLEQKAWPVLKGLLFQQALEIFMRALKSEAFSVQDVSPIRLLPTQFRSREEWRVVWSLRDEGEAGALEDDGIVLPSFWDFEKVGVIPYEAPLHLLQVVLGSHDPEAQALANQYLPSWVFNLSITPQMTIDATHERMAQNFHKSGGVWRRSYLPRTVLIFINGDETLGRLEQRARARAAAENAISNYWHAVEGTLDSKKITEAVENAVYGSPEDVAEQLKAKYHPQDRLMLWFDFNTHDNAAVKASMEAFWYKCRPLLPQEDH